MELLASELQENGTWEVTVEGRSGEGLEPDLILRSEDKTRVYCTSSDKYLHTVPEFFESGVVALACSKTWPVR